ncbi:FMN-dependent NADH-azoreductase [Pseudomonas sp. SLFW]|uniref:FMN-dependent NADH-azoreductase n=1 Tax=Pseudomonas sp. SLFW TaxID=2683259 RepID=UPI0014131A93|nr:NAD(P)H-dependent oxidoreductase [Pseudomonas sp. SLFW]NBB12658.1 FMN-dependent NADH-azoreductase [Pseudomonas sp. SLFW]
MPHLLYIESSPRKQRSATIEVAKAFIDAWQAQHAIATVDTLDVWNEPLPAFDGATLDAKYAGIQGVERTPEQAAAWARISELAERFVKADIILFGVPMWNFGIPYTLKHLIDVVSQKDLLFTFDERGLNGLLGGRKVVVIAARGAPLDRAEHQIAYMTTWSEMVGIDEQFNIVIEKTLLGPDVDAESRQTATKAAIDLAATL